MALAVTTASVNKTANVTSTPHQQRWWTPTALLHHRHRLQLTSATFSSPFHRVLQSSSIPAHIFYFFIADLSRSTASSSTTSAIVLSPASSCSTSTTIAGASSSPPEGISYSFITTWSNDINTEPIHFPLMTNKHSSSTPTLFSQWPNKRLFKHDLFSSLSQVIFTDTAVPPIQFSSWR